MKTLLCDLGGCFLTNAWDREARARACAEFGIDAAAFERLHEGEVDRFEKGSLTLDEYLTRTLSASPASAPVPRGPFVDFMKSCSRKLGTGLEILADFRRSRAVQCIVLNNESRELNEYRIETFGLRERFDAFFSSCYLGMRKPGAPIYHLALDLSGARPADCLFIDDRPENIETARQLDIPFHRFESAEGLAIRLRQ